MGFDGSEYVNRNSILFGIIVTTVIMLLPTVTGRVGWLQSFVPLPIFYYLVSEGEQKGRKIIGTAALLAAFVAAVTSTLSVLIFSFMLAPLGFLLAHEVRDKSTLNVTAAKSLLLLTAILLLTGFFVSAVNNSNPYTEILADIDLQISATYEIIEKQYGDLPFETKKELESAFQKLRGMIPKILPSLLLTMVVSTIWLNIVAGHTLLRKKSETLSPWGNLRDWRLPDWLIWGAILAGLCIVLPFNAMNIIGMNLLIFFGTFYFLQGMAVFSSLLFKWSVPPPARMAIFLLLILVQVYAIMLLIILGVADTWIDLRRVEKNDAVN